MPRNRRRKNNNNQQQNQNNNNKGKKVKQQQQLNVNSGNSSHVVTTSTAAEATAEQFGQVPDEGDGNEFVVATDELQSNNVLPSETAIDPLECDDDDDQKNGSEIDNVELFTRTELKNCTTSCGGGDVGDDGGDDSLFKYTLQNDMLNVIILLDNHADEQIDDAVEPKPDAVGDASVALLIECNAKSSVDAPLFPIQLDELNKQPELTNHQQAKAVVKPLADNDATTATTSLRNEESQIITDIRMEIVAAALQQQQYRVESPTIIALPPTPSAAAAKSGLLKKSRSLDDDNHEMVIQELSDTGSIGDNDNTPIISEAESETDDLTVLAPPFTGPMVALTVPEQLKIEEFLYDEPSDDGAELMKSKRAKKKAAIETHFLPQFLNPKHLDVIDEESDDSKSRTSSITTQHHHCDVDDDELDDDVFLDNSKISQKVNAIFPKSTFAPFGVHRHQKQHHHRLPARDVIREEPQCMLVGAKLLDRSESIEESCSKWTTSTLSTPDEQPPELVYIGGGSSSSSASDLTADDAGGDGDGDVDRDDVIVRIETPIIGGPVDGHQTISGEVVDNSLPNNFLPVLPNSSSVLPPKIPINQSSDDAVEPPLACDFHIGQPCRPSIIVDDTKFNRQDSTGSLGSSISHPSTSSQSTARYCSTSPPVPTDRGSTVTGAPSPPRDLADYEPNSFSPSGFAGDSSVATLRELCLDQLTAMPYGSMIIEELAQVSGSLGELAQKYHPKLFNDLPPSAVSADEETMPYPLPQLPKIDRVDIAIVGDNHVKSPSPPPVPQRPAAWLAMPTVQDPNVMVCISPAQRQVIQPADQPDRLLEMHRNFIERRGYHEYTTDQLTAMMTNDENRRRQSGDATASADSTMTTKAAEKNRLLAIIRGDSQQSTSENNCTTQRCGVEAINTTNNKQQQPSISTTANPSHSDNIANEKMASTSSSSSSSSTVPISQLNDFHKRFTNIDQFLATNNNNNNNNGCDIKSYSSSQKSTFASSKRTENGRVVYEHSDVSNEKSQSGDACDFFPFMKSADAKLDRTSGDEAAAAATAAATTMQSNYERRLFENQPKTTDKNSDEMVNNKNATLDAGTAAASTTAAASSSNCSAFANVPIIVDDQFMATDETTTENIIKPITKEENLCKGLLRNVQVRAPRISPSRQLYSISEQLSETKRQYDQQSTNSRYRQSMIETPTPPPPPPSYEPQRRQSLPKELHMRQLEYIRQKEAELSHEFDKLEHDRQTLLREIEQMQVNQSFQDFVTAHKSANNGCSAFLPAPISEADLFRQQMHDEWLNKVAEREERRLHKIIKITKPGQQQPQHSAVADNCAIPAVVAPPIPPAPSAAHHQKPADLGGEFLDRVKERRTKLKMPSDSDWESGAESQPEPSRRQAECQVDPTIKVLEGEAETDLHKLPEHIKEFASDFTSIVESSVSTMKSSRVTETSSSSSTSTACTKKECCGDEQVTMIDENGESTDESTPEGPPDTPTATFVGIVVAVVIICWTVLRDMITTASRNTNQR